METLIGLFLILLMIAWEALKVYWFIPFIMYFIFEFTRKFLRIIYTDLGKTEEDIENCLLSNGLDKQATNYQIFVFSIVFLVIGMIQAFFKL